MYRSRMIFAFVFIISGPVSAFAAKKAADFYKGQRGGVSPDLVDELKSDRTLAKKVLDDCRLSTETRERRTCALYAYHIGDPKLSDSVRPYLRDSDASVRVSAIQSLATIAKKDAMPWIIPLTDDSDESVRMSALTNLSRIDKLAIKALLRRKLKDTSPLVALQSASLLASAGETVDREIAITNIDKSPSNEPRRVQIKSKALKLLGYAGNESDLALLSEIASHPLDYNKGDALIGRQQLRLKLARNAAERAAILRESFDNLVTQDWAANEAIRRYQQGETEIRNLLESVANDASSRGQFYARAALDYINKK